MENHHAPAPPQKPQGQPDNFNRAWGISCGSHESVCDSDAKPHPGFSITQNGKRLQQNGRQYTYTRASTKRSYNLGRLRPDPEYGTRENLGERLVHFVLKAKPVFSPGFFACGAVPSVHYFMVTDHIVTV
jgi:hypothetical protein